MEEMKQLVRTRCQASMANMASRNPQQRLPRGEIGWVGSDSLRVSHSTSSKPTTKITCLLEHSEAPCHHSICQRLKAEDGISMLEYDTIAYYDLRISSAKGERTKDALRKQRDCQLVRDKGDVDRWQHKVLDKIKSFGTHAYQSLMNVTSQHYLASAANSVSAPRHAVISVGRRLSALCHAALSADQQQFGEAIARRIAGDQAGTSSHWWDPSRYLTYFGPVHVNFLHAAVTNVCDVLNLSATLCYEVDYCLRAFLEQFRCILKHIPHTKKSSKDVTVTQILHHAIQLIQLEQALERPGVLTKLLSGEIYDALLACSFLDEKTRAAIHEADDHCVDNLTYPGNRLDKIRENAVKSAPLASLLHISLEPALRISKLNCIIRILAKKTTTHPHRQLLEELVQQIWSLAGGCPSKVFLAAQDLQGMLSSLAYQASAHSITHQEKSVIGNLLVQAEAIWTRDVDAFNEKTFNRDVTAMEKAEIACKRDTSLCVISINQAYPGMATEDCQEFTQGYCEDLIRHQMSPKDTSYQELWFKTIKENIWRGITEAFLVYRHFHPCSELPILDTELSAILSEVHESDRILFGGGDQSLVEWLTNRYRQGWCATAAFVRLLVVVSHLSALNAMSARKMIQQFSWMTREPGNLIPNEWQRPIATLSAATISFYSILVVECTHAFGRSDIEQVVLTLLWLTMIHILTTETTLQAKFRFDYIVQFLKSTLCIQDEHITLMATHLFVILEDEQLRCVDPQNCATYPTSGGMESEAQESVEPESQHSETKVPAAIQSIRLGDTMIRHSAVRRPDPFTPTHDTQLLSITDEKLGVLEAARALKYIALRLKGLKTERIDRMSLGVLSAAFRMVEQTLNKTPPQIRDVKVSSSVAGMDNQCNVWELSQSTEKTCCFFAAYSNGLRDHRDLDRLVDSLHVWSVLSYDETDPNTFTRLADRLIRMAGEHFPQELGIRFQEEAKIHESRIEETSLAIKCRTGRLDYILSRYPEHEKPTMAFFMDLLKDTGNDNFFAYCEHLADEVGYRIGENVEQEILDSLEDLSQLLWDKKSVSADCESLKKIVQYATESWEVNDHEDVVYYNWDRPDRGTNATHMVERHVESIDGDSSESDTSGEASLDDGSVDEAGSVSDKMPPHTSPKSKQKSSPSTSLLRKGLSSTHIRTSSVTSQRAQVQRFEDAQDAKINSLNADAATQGRQGAPGPAVVSKEAQFGQVSTRSAAAAIAMTPRLLSAKPRNVPATDKEDSPKSQVSSTIDEQRPLGPLEMCEKNGICQMQDDSQSSSAQLYELLNELKAEPSTRETRLDSPTRRISCTNDSFATSSHNSRNTGDQSPSSTQSLAQEVSTASPNSAGTHPAPSDVSNEEYVSCRSMDSEVGSGTLETISNLIEVLEETVQGLCDCKATLAAKCNEGVRLDCQNEESALQEFTAPVESGLTLKASEEDELEGKSIGEAEPGTSLSAKIEVFRESLTRLRGFIV